MEIIKSYTDIEQSFKLKGILPLESADMYYDRYGTPNFIDNIVTYKSIKTDKYQHLIPCWSLTALLNIFPYPQLSKDKLGSGKERWMVSAYPDNCKFDSYWHENPIDACIEMIIHLNKLNLL